MTSGGKYKPMWKKKFSLFSPLPYCSCKGHICSLFSFSSFLHCIVSSPFSAVLSKGFVAAGLQGVPLNLTPAIHLGSAGPADCCDFDTLSEGVLCGWASILPDSPPSLLLLCCNFCAVLGQCSALLCTGEALRGKFPSSTRGTWNNTSPHPSKWTLLSEMKLKSVKQTALENQQPKLVDQTAKSSD